MCSSDLLAVIAAPWYGMTVLAVPDALNDTTRLSLLAEHPTYQDVATTSSAFATMEIKTQQFASLLGAGLSAASGNVNTNPSLVSYTPPNDTRSYFTFTVNDVSYAVMTEASYLSLVNKT